ncbi:MAG: PilN domain-containing protein [candidate division WOR-3 bacterium]|nr:PilN domain-containing protein [candidate division WOR-3 bacterium]
MIEINLLPEEERKRKREFSMPSLSLNVPGNMMFYAGIGAVVIILAVLIIIHFSQTGTIGRLTKDIDEKKTELRRLEAEKKKVENMKAKEEKISQKINTIKKLAVGKFTYPRFFDQLNRNIPDYLWLSSLKVNGERLTISGKTFSNLMITDFLTNLKSMDEFIDKGSIELKDLVSQRTDGHDIISFEISCKFLK